MLFQFCISWYINLVNWILLDNLNLVDCVIFIFNDLYISEIIFHFIWKEKYIRYIIVSAIDSFFFCNSFLYLCPNLIQKDKHVASVWYKLYQSSQMYHTYDRNKNQIVQVFLFFRINISAAVYIIQIMSFK